MGHVTVPAGTTKGAFLLRGDDGRREWALRAGLPQAGCYFTNLRQAMAGAGRNPAGICFGTNSGSIFGSADEGESWDEIARYLLTILSIEVLERG